MIMVNIYCPQDLKVNIREEMENDFSKINFIDQKFFYVKP